MAVDYLQGLIGGRKNSDPARAWIAVTLDAAITRIPRGILVGVGGVVNMTDQEGNTAALTLAPGVWPLCPSVVLTASTTATGIYLLY